jgi:hypothetical protein
MKTLNMKPSRTFLWKRSLIELTKTIFGVRHASVEITFKKYNRFVPNLTREDGSAFEKFMDSDRQNGHIQGTQKVK